MKTASKAKDPLAIPDFLKVANRGKIKAKGAKAPVAVKAVDPVAEVLANLDDELRIHILKEVTAGRAQRSWLLDRSTIQLFRDELTSREAKKAAGMARLAQLKEERKKEKGEAPPKPVFGAGITIKVMTKENPRKAGTSAHERFAKMAAFVKKYPKASFIEISDSTGYRKDDLAWDEQRGSVKTDVASNGNSKKEAKK